MEMFYSLIQLKLVAIITCQIKHNILHIHSSPLSAAYMHQWIGSALIQIMACHLFGTKPFPEPLLAYCKLDPWDLNQNFIIFVQINWFKNVICQDGSHFVQGKMN